jgi:Abnormal spindle-like microcephaly-assoc'd, ASPM-SPD-2-Hydin
MRLPQYYAHCAQLRFFALTTVVFAQLFTAYAAAQQLTCSPSQLHFGGVALGHSESQVVILTNTGKTDVEISAIAASDSEFSVSGVTLPVVVAPGQAIPVTVTYTAPAIGWTGGTVTITSNALNSSLQFSVGGTGYGSDPVNATPSSLSFGSVAVGSSTTRSISLTNVRPWTKALTSFYVLGKGFSVSDFKLPIVMNPQQTITLDVTFSPRSAEEVSGSIFIYGPGLNIPLTGTGTTTTSAAGMLSFTPASLTFGSVDVGTSAAQGATLTASGGNVTIHSATSSNSEFYLAGISLPLTLTAGQSASAKVVFSPTKSGSASGSLSIVSNASNAQVADSLSGTGVVPEYSVSLSWNASSSPVAGYNVYRGTAVGSYSKINSALDPSTTYTDSTVVSGTTYYYAATAVSSSGIESGYSAPLQVVIP